MSLSFPRTYKTLLDDVTAAGAGNWIPLANAYNNIYSAVYTVSLESGDWVTLQGSIQPFPKTPAAMSSYSPFLVSIAIVSATDTVTVNSPFFAVRAVKTGTAGKAKVATYG